jgi:hypothetical protein
VSAYAQQTASESQPAKPAASVSATTRLLNAKTVCVKKIAGGDIAFDIVNNAIVGWPRYIVVDDPGKADLLIEVSSPAPPKKDENNGVKGSSGSGAGSDPRALPAPTNTYTDTDVKIFVRDAHTKAILWSGREPAKEAFRQAKTDENLIEAAQKLVQKLHDRVEPPAPPTPQ